MEDLRRASARVARPYPTPAIGSPGATSRNRHLLRRRTRDSSSPAISRAAAGRIGGAQIAPKMDYETAV